MSITKTATYATLPHTVRGIPIVLGADPKGKNFLYTNDKDVVIRDVESPRNSDLYVQHAVKVTVAKYSPSGFYIASGDMQGKIRVWDTTNVEHILKCEYHVLGGAIKDIAWSADSQRIVVGGEGREKFGYVFTMNTGTSLGQISGHTKAINACDFKPTRPFRIVTASEDQTVGFYEGPPFKRAKEITDHTNFVNCVRYSPNGEIFISAGADGKCFIYDGKNADLKGQLGSPAHKGGIYGISFSADNNQLLTASADKTCKVWNVEANNLTHEFCMGKSIEDMQVSCLWIGDYLLSVSLSGFINYLDVNNTAQPSRILKGQNKPYTAMALSKDRSHVYVAASNGLISIWNAQTGENVMMQGSGHHNQVQTMAICDSVLATCSMDDTVRFSCTDTNTYGDSIKLDSQPQDLAGAEGGLVIVACLNEIVVLRNQKVVFVEKVKYEPCSVAIHPGQTDVVVGARDRSGIHIYTLEGDTLVSKQDHQLEGPICSLRFSPDGAFFAVSDGKKIVLYSLPNYEKIVSSAWSHNAKCVTMGFSPDSNYLASGSLDTNICVWNPNNKKKVCEFRSAHPISPVNCIAWLDNNSLVSAGQDTNLNLWSFTPQ